MGRVTAGAAQSHPAHPLLLPGYSWDIRPLTHRCTRPSGPQWGSDPELFRQLPPVSPSFPGLSWWPPLGTDSWVGAGTSSFPLCVDLHVSMISYEQSQRDRDPQVYIHYTSTNAHLCTHLYMLIHPSIHPTHLLSIYYIPRPILGAEAITRSKIKTLPLWNS